MSVRLAFAVAAHLEPEILLVDEVLAVGDAEFQRRCLGRMEDLSKSGRTVVFVSHQMQAVAQLCDRAILLEKGGVVRDGPSGDVVAQYLQSIGGSASTADWPDLDSAPGDDLVRLRSVARRRQDGESTRRCRRARVRRDRDRVHGPAARWAADLPEDQGVRRAAERRVQRDRHERALARAGAARRVRVDRVDSGQSPERGADQPSTSACARSARSSYTPTPAANDAVSFHVQDPGEGDSAKGRFTGQLQGVVRPLLEWTTRET